MYGVGFIVLTLLLHPIRTIAKPTIRIGVSTVVEVDPFVRHTLKELSEAMSDYPFVVGEMSPTQILSASKKREFDFLIVGPQTMVLLDLLGLATLLRARGLLFPTRLTMLWS